FQVEHRAKRLIRALLGQPSMPSAVSSHAMAATAERGMAKTAKLFTVGSLVTSCRLAEVRSEMHQWCQSGTARGFRDLRSLEALSLGHGDSGGASCLSRPLQRRVECGLLELSERQPARAQP